MAIENANSHPYKVAITKESGVMYANSHPYQVVIVGGGGGQEGRVVDELPEVGEPGYIYLVLKEESSEGNIYDEYMWVLQRDGETYGWEHIATTDEVKVPAVVQTTGTSTEDVMSQNATTSMVFADPATRNNVKIGRNTGATGYYSVALGYQANAQGNNNIAIGRDANVNSTATNAVAIGEYSFADAKGQFDISTLGNGVSSTEGYNNSAYRLLTGLYEPQSDHDAATKGYVDTAIAGVGVKELTTADYNYPTASPTCVALWLLDPGQYAWGSGMRVYFNDFGATTLNAGGAIVIKNATNTGIATIIAQSDYGKRNIYETNVSNGYPTGTSTMQFGGPEDILKVKNVYDVSGATLRSVKLGNDNTVGTNSISIGIGANGSANATYTTIIGANAATAWNGNVALGAYSGTNAIFDAVGEVAINSTNTNYGYNNSNYRLLRGLYDPQADHDAANKQYVDTAVASAGAAEINSTDWSDLWQ